MASSGAGERGMALLIWIIVFTVLCLIFLLLRFWALFVSRRKLALDDFMILFAFANTFSLEGVAVWAIFNGLGKHTDEVDPTQYGIQFKFIFSACINWLLATVFIKLSVVWLYARIFTTQSFQRWCYVVVGIICAYGVGFFILFMARCSPVSHQWDPQPGGRCHDLYYDQITSVPLNLVIDVIVILLPMRILWSLQLPVRSKLTVSVMFCIGFITVAIICWRLANTIQTRYDQDFIYNLYLLGLIGFLELWLGIIVACFPTLAPLFNMYVKPKMSRATGNSSTDPIEVSLRDMKTIGGSGASRNRKGAGLYSQLEEDGHVNGSDELKLVRGANGHMMETQCHADRSNEWPMRPAPAATPADAIRVQREFHYSRQ